MKRKKAFGIIISVLMVFTMIPLNVAADSSGGSLDNFKRTLKYEPGRFSDVKSSDWFVDNVAAAYEYQLVNGTSATSYEPNSNITIAQTITLAARLHSIYYGDGELVFKGQYDPWYQPYVNYAIDNGIIKTSEYSSVYNKYPSRQRFAYIMASALPSEAFYKINDIKMGQIPDVDTDSYLAPAVYQMYNAGILTGNDSSGAFLPKSAIRRSEVAAIVTRIADPTLRKSVKLVEFGTITDTWEEIIASINDGSYKNRYAIGNTKTLDLGPEGVVEMQIAAFDADELADRSGKAAITWISKQVLNSEHQMNPNLQEDHSGRAEYKIGTGCIGGWEYTEMRAWLKSYVKPLIPSQVRKNIKSVIKYTDAYDTSGRYIENIATREDIWIPSNIEMSTKYDENRKGPSYPILVSSDFERKKRKADGSDVRWWWLRSCFLGMNYTYSYETGDNIGIGTYPINSAGVVLCFCT